VSEETDHKSETYRFDDCVIDADRREIVLAGKTVTTQPKAFELLLYLIRHRSRAVDKDELQDALWPRSIVTETALTRCVMKARRAVGDDADRQTVIKTVHGHGYRFVAEIEDAVTSPSPDPPPQLETGKQRAPWIAGAVALVAAVAFAWWYVTPPALSGEIRLAVLPVENATGNRELDWVRTGMMSLMNRMLEAKGILVVGERSIIDLAADRPLGDLTRKDGDFLATLGKTTGYTHTLAAEFRFEQGLYRLNYTFAGGDMRPQERTIVGKEPARLVKEAIDVVSSLVQTGPPPEQYARVISDDDFLNEAYARAMSLEFEGNYEDAKRFFQLIIDQEPELFWPRYEYALCVRNLRDWDTAERLLAELVEEQRTAGHAELEAAARNGLGVLYYTQRRNDEAVEAFDRVIELVTDRDRPMYVVTAHVNLALVARNRGELAEAASHLEAAQTVLQGLDLQSYPGSFHQAYAGILMQLGDLDKAEQQALAAIENFQLTGERLYAAYAQSRLSSIYRESGRFDEARELTEQALAVRREFNDSKGIASSLVSLAELSVETGDLTRARQYAEQVRDIGVETDSQDIVAGALQQIALVDMLTGNPAEAAKGYAAAEAIHLSIDDPMGAAGARIGIARSRMAMGDFGEAGAIANQLLQQARDAGQDRAEARALILLGEVDLARRQWNGAIGYLDTALEIADRIADPSIAFPARRDLARAWLELGDPDAAQPYLDAIALARPDHTDVLRLQARMAWERGDVTRAAESMTLARNGAGEAWNDDDAARLERYRAALGDSHPD